MTQFVSESNEKSIKRAGKIEEFVYNTTFNGKVIFL